MPRGAAPLDPERLRVVRLERGLTQLELAELLGIAREQLVRYEAGTHRPMPARSAKIAEVLRVPLRELLYG